MKSLCVLARRADLSRADFQDYYEHNHVTLAIRYFPFVRYARNHVVSGADAFDTLSEFWSVDNAGSAELMAGPVGDTMREDEARFMDRSRIAPGGSEEHVLSAGVADGPRVATLIRGEGPDFRDAVLAWGRSVAAATPGVSVDFVTAWSDPAFPADAVLFSPVDPGASPASLGEVRRLTLRRIETPPETLLGNA